jgi:hypothetical protein
MVYSPCRWFGHAPGKAGEKEPKEGGKRADERSIVIAPKQKQKQKKNRPHRKKI